jgi:hypothetical protein
MLTGFAPVVLKVMDPTVTSDARLTVWKAVGAAAKVAVAPTAFGVELVSQLASTIQSVGVVVGRNDAARTAD